MTAFDLLKTFYSRNFFRFTGPPENWLTAIKYMTWGLEQKYLNNWKKIQTGDVFFMHSMADSLYVKKPKPSIVGVGVVGKRFRTKNDFLWIHEIREKINRWPLLVPFSELYLFSEIPPSNSWDAPGIGSNEKIGILINAMLKDAIPTHALGDHRFPVMGSWSSVRSEVVDQIFGLATPTLYQDFYENDAEEQKNAQGFSIVEDAIASIRHIPSLKFLEGSLVKVRKAASPVSTFDRDNTLLERAEEGHATVLQQAIGFFRKQGFDTWSNPHVDLLATSEDQAFLVEVKSTLNQNFRPQARRAVGQLFEYEHFDVRKHFEKRKDAVALTKVLMINNNPADSDYCNFLNTLKICLGWPEEEQIRVSGDPGPLAPFL